MSRKNFHNKTHDVRHFILGQLFSGLEGSELGSTEQARSHRRTERDRHLVDVEPCKHRVLLQPLPRRRHPTHRDGVRAL